MMDKIISEKPLGCHVENGQTVFRLFAPRAKSVRLALFQRHDQQSGKEIEMSPSEDGVWECALEGTYWGAYYGYKIAGPNIPIDNAQNHPIIADPYSKAVVSKNTFRHEAKSIIVKTDDYDWEGDTFVNIPQEDLIIYELHVRDMTAHPSSGVHHKGTYHGLIERAAPGGFEHILELGVNAVELLPCQDFGNIEIPFEKEENGVRNFWNPYERNHWGYMTSYFFAPESYYASGGTMQPDADNGIHGQQVNEFKDLVKAFHKEGIAIIMDVVYNHVSHYDWNPLKYIDPKYYFRLDRQGEFLNLSGCGNDFKTERPMARRLILDSIKYWLQEVHIDGFRFDLATLIDWETIEVLTEEARRIHPNVVFIAEPWGGGKYDLAGFSERGWAAWNDLFRNRVKGQNPVDGKGWLFGEVRAGDALESLKGVIRGSTKKNGGPFVESGHSVNYLESHDDYTLGDFIRIGSGKVKPDEKVTDVDAHAMLDSVQIKLNKLAAAFLLTSQGAVMIGEGQEFARSKVIAKTEAPDPHVGQIDHNSYNKDNETNWLNFEHRELNRELFDYYRGLIALRKAHPALRHTPGEKIRFLECRTDCALGYFLPKEPAGDEVNFTVLFNAHPESSAQFTLPKGGWRKVVDGKRAGTETFGKLLTGRIVVPARSSVVLIQETTIPD
ncbi:MAG: pullulanase [bacterium]